MNFLTQTIVDATTQAPQIMFEPGNFLYNLRYMGIGMVVIFVVIGIIILATTLTNYLLSK